MDAGVAEGIVLCLLRDGTTDCCDNLGTFADVTDSCEDNDIGAANDGGDDTADCLSFSFEHTLAYECAGFDGFVTFWDAEPETDDMLQLF